MTRARWIGTSAVALSLSCAADVSLGASSPNMGGPSPPATVSKEDPCASDDLAALAQWFCVHQIKLRQSFDNDDLESKPALLSFESSKDKKDYYNIDAALRFHKWTAHNDSLQWYPTVELHKSSESNNEIDKKSAALKLEYYFMAADGGGPGLGIPQGASIRPYMLLDTRVTRDSQAHETEGSASVLFSLRSVGPVTFGPGRPIRCAASDHLHCFRWRPYLGLEHYHRFAVGPEDAKSNFTGNVDVTKVEIEFYPVHAERYRMLEFIAGGEYRNRLSSSDAMPRNATLWTGQLNWYLDKAGTVALGADFTNGRGPDNNFVHDNRYGLSIKLKFTD